jgi:hypothetical protein
MRLRTEYVRSLYRAITSTRRRLPGAENKMADLSVFYETWGFPGSEIHIVGLWIMIRGGLHGCGGIDCLFVRVGSDEDIVTI